MVNMQIKWNPKQAEDLYANKTKCRVKDAMQYGKIHI